MKSKQNDADLLAEAYNLIHTPTTIEERMGYEDVECPGCADCVDDTLNTPMAVAVEIPEPAEENYPDDSEVHMAMAELYKIEKYANGLSQLLQGMPALEGWTASKITKAADYLGSVFHKLYYDVNGHSVHNTGYEDAMEDSE